jgi:hypothetical protein
VRCALVLLVACGRPAPTPAPPVVAHVVVPDAAAVVVAPPDAAEPDAPAVAVQEDAGPELDLGSVSIGPLHLGTDAKDAVKVLGKPKTASKPTLMGATGAFMSEWDWGAVALQMAGSTEKGPFFVASINVAGSSQFKTNAGIGIGSTRGEVTAVYGTYLAHTDDPDTVLVGSIYGGLLLHLEHDRVTAMYLGALAF